MQYYLLEHFLGNLSNTLGLALYFIIQIISFTGLFLIAFGLFEGFVLGKWRYGYFLTAIIVIGLVGINPAIDLVVKGFPNIFEFIE